MVGVVLISIPDVFNWLAELLFRQIVLSALTARRSVRPKILDRLGV